MHAVLVRCRLNRLSHLDRATGEPVRRYEHPHPGSMLHVDVTKFGNVPDGRGHRFLGRQQGRKNRTRTAARTGARTARSQPKLGTAYVHTVIDDHSRVAYAEIHNDETATTAIGVLHRAVAWFAARGVVTERVLSDNGSAYRSHAWRDACTELGIVHKRTRPYRPQPNSQDRTLPPHPQRRLGLRPPLHQRDNPPQSPPRLDPPLQSPPAPHRDREPPTHHTLYQPVRAIQLGRVPQGIPVTFRIVGPCREIRC